MPQRQRFAPWLPPLMLALLAASDAATSFSGATPASLGAFLRAAEHFSRAQLGGLASAVYLGRLVASVPGGWWSDRFGVRTGLILAAASTALAMGAATLAPSFIVLYVALFAAGLGFGISVPATNKGVTAWYPAERRALAMGLKQTGVTVGYAAAAALLPVVAAAYGWRAGFLVAMAMTAAVGATAILLWRPRQPGAAIVANGRFRWLEDARLMLAAVQRALAHRSLLRLGLAAMAFIVVQSSVQAYLMIFLIDVSHYPAVLAGVFLMLLNIGGIAGRVTWGALVDRFFPGQQALTLVGVAVGEAVILILFNLASGHAPAPVIAVLVVLLGMTALGWNGLALNLMAETLPGEQAGLGSGIGLTIGFVGAMIGTPAIGKLVDLTGSYHLGWLVTAASGLAAAAILYFDRSRTVPEQG